MAHYIVRRLLLILPTLLGILLINFIIIQTAPGGPVEQMIAQLQGIKSAHGFGSTGADFASDAGGTAATGSTSGQSLYRGARGLPPEVIARIESMYGFDKPAHQRFFMMLGSYLRFDFGSSYFRGRPVLDLILEKIPVSLSLGLWSTLLIYLISIPLGIQKALRHGSRFDVASSVAIIIGYAIPGFLFAVLLVVLFAGGSYWSWFPLR